MSSRGVICRDCPYQDVWYPGRTDRDNCKHDLVRDDHTVDYVDPSEISQAVSADGDLVATVPRGDEA